MAAARVYLYKHETLVEKQARIKNHCILNMFDVLDTMVLYSAKCLSINSLIDKRFQPENACLSTC